MTVRARVYRVLSVSTNRKLINADRSAPVVDNPHMLQNGYFVEHKATGPRQRISENALGADAPLSPLEKTHCSAKP